jgi:hypothetical protein
VHEDVDVLDGGDGGELDGVLDHQNILDLRVDVVIAQFLRKYVLLPNPSRN